MQLRLNTTYGGGNGNSGLLIRDNNDNISGFIFLNDRFDGYILKLLVLISNTFNIRINK